MIKANNLKVAFLRNRTWVIINALPHLREEEEMLPPEPLIENVVLKLMDPFTGCVCVRTVITDTFFIRNL